MKPMLLKIISTIATVVLSASVIVAKPPGRSADFASFKREMMPKVGKKITVTGTLRSAKLGWLVAFKEWGIYIYATKNSDHPKMNALNAFNDRTVKVTGTLRYNSGSHSEDTTAATVPEHFFFDVAEAKVSNDNPPRSKNSKGNRAKHTPKSKAH